MKINLTQFRINSLTYESIDDLEKVFGEDAPESFQAQEKRSIESEYSLKKDRKAVLVSSEIKLNTIPENTELTDEYFGIQTVTFNAESIFNLNIDEDEKEIVENMNVDELIEALKHSLDIMIEMRSNDILNFMASHGPWAKAENYTATFEIDISNK
ncbi:hypothetical protein [Leuconostoc citreum]|uniref:hypothetical protein n=1 Tax=Leuconostoc citreum TaxID=33964 RepID=UPI0025A07A61|nr:hypothetical protein [Leuconostoc citreum]MDM7641111.1 hypothetical protein [Leuconostoc citreum]